LLSPAQVVGWQFQARWDSTDSLLDPRRGIRAHGDRHAFLQHRAGNIFVSARAQASTYWDVTGDGRSILAVRGSVGPAARHRGAQRADHPALLRRRRRLGARLRLPVDRTAPAGQPAQLRRLLSSTAPVEWRQRFGSNWGAVAFLDGGRVGGGGGAGRTAESAAWRAGAGLGARYYTVIGPVRSGCRAASGEAALVAGLRPLHRHRARLLMRRLWLLLLGALIVGLPLTLTAQPLPWLTGVLAARFLPGLTIEGQEGGMPTRFAAARVTYADARGVWLTIERPELRFALSGLLRRRVVLTLVTAESISVARWPESAAAQPADSGGGLPQLPVAVELRDVNLPAHHPARGEARRGGQRHPGQW
jgi:hypothetical protein